LAELLTI